MTYISDLQTQFCIQKGPIFGLQESTSIKGLVFSIFPQSNKSNNMTTLEKIISKLMKLEMGQKEILKVRLSKRQS